MLIKMEVFEAKPKRGGNSSDITIPKNVIENEKQLMDSLHESSKNSTVIKFILEDIRRTAEYSRDIAEVVMDENIQNVISEA